MYYIGIDIGSTCAKTAVIDGNGELYKLFVIPTGWSSFQALTSIENELEIEGIEIKDAHTIATGYGRKAVAFADKAITEITCHAKGSQYLFGDGAINVIDVGGQDTKVISASDGKVEEFYMNDKCSAGTGKFVEVMANRLNLPVEDLSEYAKRATEKVKISSMCTVFAESEIVTMIGQGTSRENIAWGILNSIAVKVKQEYGKLREDQRPIYLTGGLCENEFFQQLLSEQIGKRVKSCPNARYAGAIGAAMLAKERYNI